MGQPSLSTIVNGGVSIGYVKNVTLKYLDIQGSVLVNPSYITSRVNIVNDIVRRSVGFSVNRALQL